MQYRKETKLLLIIISLFGWFALIGQFYLIIINRVTSVPETIIRYFSFFTILTNLIVAICCSALLSKSNSGMKNFFFRQNTLTAIAVYITIVGLVYNFILRFLWKPQGLQWVVDELLHSRNSIIIYCILAIVCTERKITLEKRFGVAVISHYLPGICFIPGNTFLILSLSIYRC